MMLHLAQNAFCVVIEFDLIPVHDSVIGAISGFQFAPTT